MQLAFDAILFGVAMVLRDPVTMGWSFPRAVILKLTITVNHRKDRYIA